MFQDKQKIIDILQELEGVWDLASGFKKLIILSSNEDIINLLYDIIFTSIQKIKIEIAEEKKLLLEQKLQEIKQEEKYKQQKADNFLENNLF